MEKLAELHGFLDDRFENTLTEADWDQVYIDWWETEFRCAVYSEILDRIANGETLDKAIEDVMKDRGFIKESLDNGRALAEFA